MNFLKFSILVSVVFLLLACSDNGMNKATKIHLAMLPDQDVLVQQERFALRRLFGFQTITRNSGQFSSPSMPVITCRPATRVTQDLKTSLMISFT